MPLHHALLYFRVTLKGWKDDEKPETSWWAWQKEARKPLWRHQLEVHTRMVLESDIKFCKVLVEWQEVHELTVLCFVRSVLV